MSAETPVMLITGTRKGIGRALCKSYLEEGWRIAGCSRGGANIESGRYCHYELDVADEMAVKKMVMDVGRKFGRIDVLLNNAGVASMNHFMLTPKSTISRIFETNVFGSFLFCREAAKVMSKTKWGRIVNFATVATPLKLEGEAAYAASKAAIVTLTEILAREVAHLGVTVNAVGPTPVPTDLVAGVPKEKMDALLSRQAIRRFGELRDIKNIVDFFIREESDFVTGQTLYLGGV